MFLFEQNKNKVKWIAEGLLLLLSPFQVLGSEKISVVSKVSLLINDKVFSSPEVLTLSLCTHPPHQMK